MVLHMREIILFKPFQTPENHICRLKSNRTVRRIFYVLRRIMDQLQRLLAGSVIQNVLQKLFQLSQADPARNAFPAGLRMTDLEHGKLLFHGTDPGGISCNPLGKLFAQFLTGSSHLTGFNH